MLLKKSIQKAKKILQKTIENIKSMLFGSYGSIPRTLFLNPLSCTSINKTTHQSDHIITQLSNQTIVENAMNQTVKTISENAINDVHHKEIVSSSLKNEYTSGNSSCRYENEGGYKLAQKMKELDMMEIGDIDHALDVEEALNYYSRLRCQVYVDIVDKFFMDMYEEFLVHQSNSLGSSSRRLGPLKL